MSGGGFGIALVVGLWLLLWLVDRLIQHYPPYATLRNSLGCSLSFMSMKFVFEIFIFAFHLLSICSDAKHSDSTGLFTRLGWSSRLSPRSGSISGHLCLSSSWSHRLASCSSTSMTSCIPSYKQGALLFPSRYWWTTLKMQQSRVRIQDKYWFRWFPESLSLLPISFCFLPPCSSAASFTSSGMQWQLSLRELRCGTKGNLSWS